jgi:hypothetical protein
MKLKDLLLESSPGFQEESSADVQRCMKILSFSEKKMKKVNAIFKKEMPKLNHEAAAILEISISEFEKNLEEFCSMFYEFVGSPFVPSAPPSPESLDEEDNVEEAVMLIEEATSYLQESQKRFMSHLQKEPETLMTVDAKKVADGFQEMIENIKQIMDIIMEYST